MEVTNYELFEVPPRWQFLKIETDEGIVGWGEPYTKWHIEDGSTPTTHTAVAEMMESYVLGNDPRRIEDLWQAMYRSSFYRGGPVQMSAIAGIDQALWDLKGKHYDAPAHELLGGPVRDRIRLYQHVSAVDPETAAESAQEAVDEGFSALKVTPMTKLERVDTPTAVNEGRAIIAAIREAIGSEIDIGVDLHGRVAKPLTKRVAGALEPYNPMFIEEPVTPEHNDALPAIAASTDIPIATGERLYTRSDFKPVLESGALDVVQPDVSHAGGITETKKIADMAASYDAALAPHCPVGPISVAASLQIDACAPNALVQEQTLHRKDGWRAYLNDASVFEYDVGGYLEPPSGPGLGVELDEEAIRERAGEDMFYERPVRRHDDGSIAEQ